jgi:hypothetical protein
LTRPWPESDVLSYLLSLISDKLFTRLGYTLTLKN